MGKQCTFNVKSKEVARKEALLRRAGWVRSGHTVTVPATFIYYTHGATEQTITLNVTE